jgi:acylglycerol lipase
MTEEFFLTNLELRDSTETGEVASGLSHASMKGMFLLSVLELAARGEPRGAVTVLHDAGDAGARYRGLASALAGGGWAVALPDLRGHGQTEGPRGHSTGLKEVWRDIEEIQNHLAYRMPDEPKVLVGQGLGALYALSYALENPGAVAALVLAAPLHEPRFTRPQPPGGLKKLLGKKPKGDDPGSIGYRGDQLSSDSAVAAAWGSADGTHDVISLRAIDQAEEAARTYLPRAAQAGLPVLILHGEADPIADVERSRALAGDGNDVTVRTFPGMLHHPLQEANAAEVHDAVVSWLDGVLAR